MVFFFMCQEKTNLPIANKRFEDETQVQTRPTWPRFEKEESNSRATRKWVFRERSILAQV